MTGSRILPAIAAATLSGLAAAGDPPSVQLGEGSYYDGLPDSAARPTNTVGQAISPRVSPGFSAPPPTNEFWSSWIYSRAINASHGSLIHPHPLIVRAVASGLGISYSPNPTIDSRGYQHNLDFTATLIAGIQGLDAPEVRTESCGDWHVRGEWPDDGRTMLATIGHGLPVVTIESDPANTAAVEFLGPVTVFADLGDTLGLRMGDIIFGLFAPGDWTLTASDATAPLTGRGAYAVAALPDDSPDTLALFRQHAFARVTDTRVEWHYDQPAGEVAVTHTFESESLDGTGQPPLVALYRHQWLYAAEPTPENYLGTYASPRGEMKLTATNSFTCRFPFRGVLPSLPEVGTFQPGQLEALVNQAESINFDLGSDTYWSGKSMQKAAVLAPIAEQAGDPAARDTFLSYAKSQLEDWFNTNTGSRYFAYDPNWRTLLGTPGSFNLAQEMNDHHFHYGYHIFTAAIIAMHDPAWADDYADIVELLIRDVANWDRADTRYPFLRNFDPYAAHGWASGHSAFDTGNNQESSSESMNFATALILWGSVMGRDDIRDLGVYLHATEAVAIEQYWFDADKAVFPAGLSRPLAGIVWSNGTRYTTWWTNNPEEIHGINFLPVTAGSLYLGRKPGAMLNNWNLLLSQNGGPPTEWAGILWSALATADPALALQQLEANPGAPVEAGDTRARTEHWIRTLAATGPVDASVSADCPTATVFAGALARTYAAWNPGPDPLTVRFSDGFGMLVAPGDLTAAQRGLCPSDLAAPFGVLSQSDITEFITAFLAGLPQADLDADGLIALADVNAFVAGFLQSCGP